MATFAYTALDSADAYTKGSLQARSERQARRILEAQDLLIVNLRREGHAVLSEWRHRLWTISAQERIFFTRNILTMLEAGIGIDQAVKTTAEQTTSRKFRDILHDVHARIQKGQPFYRALEHYPRFFSGFFVSLVKIGEASGKLHETLAQLLEQQEKDFALRSKARGAMIYPSIILAALLIMVTLMLVFVIPRVTGILTTYRVDLPWPTKILLFLSRMITHYGFIIVPLLILAVVGFRRLIRDGRGRQRWDSFLLHLPRINGLIREFNLALYARSMNALLRSGLSIDQALKLSAQVATNVHYRQAAQSGLSLVRRGIPLAEVMKGQPKLYSPLSIRMVEVGEKTGKLDYMLGRLASYYEQSVETSLTNLSSVIEPVLLLVIGLVVGFVAISVMMPIWRFSQTV